MGLIAELTALTADGARPALAPIIATLRTPPRVALTGRPGAGRRTLAAALGGTGVRCADDTAGADAVLLVVTETVTPEDRPIYTDTTRPLRIVLNKADALDDPTARAAAITGRTGVPTVAVSALHGTGLAALSAEIDAATAPTRYRRLRAALTRLRALAATDTRLAELLAGDTAVWAAADAAADVLRAAGLDPVVGPPLRCARHWQRYGGGPVGRLHADCAADLVRGQLRLAGPPGPAP